MKKFYAGIGSRKTPLEVQSLMTSIAVNLCQQGFVLRSGGAEGADKAFELGVNNDLKEIYLPWKGFNSNSSNLYNVSEEALKFAKQFHPYWYNLGKPSRLLVARNGYQILGLDFKTPVEFIICWTEHGLITGGTGQAIRIAKSYKIPVYNLFLKVDLEFCLKRYLYEQRCI